MLGGWYEQGCVLSLVMLSSSTSCHTMTFVHIEISTDDRPGSDWVDPDDLTVIAENELLNAAMSIEAAANKLAQLKPRPVAAKVC